MAIPGAQKTISDTVRNWVGITEAPHRFGGKAYRVGKREVGHIHGDRLVDIPFSKKVRDQLVEDGEAEPHHVLPGTGWVSVLLECQGDIDRAIRLLRRSYDGLKSRHALAPARDNQ
jgi:hypothetical protein